MRQKEIITLRFRETNTEVVHGKYGLVQMISFEGDTKTEWFKGRTLPGSIDTQQYQSGMPGRVSARYILEGQDRTGEKCRIFVENNGTTEEDGILKTTPILITDSNELQWIEDVEWQGELEFDENDIIIHIFERN